MSSLYLNRIRLEQYRTFKSLDIGLPDGPGVLVVHGSNGIGKSSMFDGLEWALTDKIDHFRDADGVKKVGSYLCRWREGAPGPTSVTLDFTGGNSLSRTLSSSRATKSTVAGSIPDIAEFLRDEGWDRNISELSSYLLLTHFLGQSTKSRLTNREPGGTLRYPQGGRSKQTGRRNRQGAAREGKYQNQPRLFRPHRRTQQRGLHSSQPPRYGGKPVVGSYERRRPQ